MKPMDDKSKVIGEGTMEMTKAGGSNSGASGPTGSSRSYPKGSSVSRNPSGLNPMNENGRKAGYAVNGV